VILKQNGHHVILKQNGQQARDRKRFLHEKKKSSHVESGVENQVTEISDQHVIPKQKKNINQHEGLAAK